MIGAPLFQKATLRLENGSQFVIEAPANGPDNRYIQMPVLPKNPSIAPGSVTTRSRAAGR